MSSERASNEEGFSLMVEHHDDDAECRSSRSLPSSTSSVSSSSSILDTDSDEETLQFLQTPNIRHRRNRSGANHTSIGSYSSTSGLIGSWVSSYARSAGFPSDFAPPGQRVAFDADGRASSDVESLSPTAPQDMFDCDGGETQDTSLASVLVRRESYGTVGQATEVFATGASGIGSLEEDMQPKSTYAQSIFNSVNLLMGIGVLSLPFAFRLTGWIVGCALLAVCCMMTHHTASLLAYCLDYTPRFKPPATTERRFSEPLLTSFPKMYRRAATYGDIGELAYGISGRAFISILFCLELTAAGVALVILMSDSVTALFPSWHHAVVKAIAVFTVIPMTWPLSLSWASYGSLVGVVALVNLLFIIWYDGLTTTETPGSLVNPALTRLWPNDWMAVPMSIGLIMAGFCGHSVFPNIYRDMIEPQKYNKMLNVSYIVTTIVYISIAACGYLMFGDLTMPEITQNLPGVPSYNRLLNQMTLWLIAVNPLTKFPLNMNPINVQIEHTLHTLFPNRITFPFPLPMRILARTVTSLLILTIAIIFPTFHSIMGLLGSFFAVIVCVVFPSLCYLRLYGRTLGVAKLVVEVGIVVLGVVLGAMGTVWAFIGASV